MTSLHIKQPERQMSLSRGQVDPASGDTLTKRASSCEMHSWTFLFCTFRSSQRFAQRCGSGAAETAVQLPSCLGVQSCCRLGKLCETKTHISSEIRLYPGRRAVDKRGYYRSDVQTATYMLSKAKSHRGCAAFGGSAIPQPMAVARVFAPAGVPHSG